MALLDRTLYFILGFISCFEFGWIAKSRSFVKSVLTKVRVVCIVHHIHDYKGKGRFESIRLMLESIYLIEIRQSWLLRVASYRVSKTISTLNLQSDVQDSARSSEVPGSNATHLFSDSMGVECVSAAG
jgi:hypothetical protein